MRRFARAAADVLRLQREGYEPLPHQRIALDKAGAALNAVRPQASRDLRAAFAREVSLVDEAAWGRTANAIRAMMLEAELRTNPELRADRMMDEWRKLERSYRAARREGDWRATDRVESRIHAWGKSLERDPQAESPVRQRLRALVRAPVRTKWHRAICSIKRFW